jgi:hypothetical protein
VRLTSLLKKLNQLLTVEGIESIFISLGKMTRGQSLPDHDTADALELDRFFSIFVLTADRRWIVYDAPFAIMILQQYFHNTLGWSLEIRGKMHEWVLYESSTKKLSSGVTDSLIRMGYTPWPGLGCFKRAIKRQPAKIFPAYMGHVTGCHGAALDPAFCHQIRKILIIREWLPHFLRWAQPGPIGRRQCLWKTC